MNCLYPSIVLCLALLIDVSLASSNTTSSSGLPLLTSRSQHSTTTQSSSSSQTSSRTSSSYVATFTPLVPNASGNKYIYQDSQRGGTVFIAVGSCLGFIILCCVIVWLLFGLRAWRSARQEYKLKEVENKYQYDPFYFAGTSGKLDNPAEYSDTDDGSDISEKVLKTRSSRLSTYSLGSNSALNLLQQQSQHGLDVLVDPNAALFNASNMFISPTEVLKNHGHNGANLNLSPPISSLESSGGSNFSTPREHTFGQIIDNPAYSNLPPVMRNKFLDSSSLSLSGLSSSNENLNNDSTPPGAKVCKAYRPPSAHLETLLDRNL